MHPIHLALRLTLLDLLLRPIGDWFFRPVLLVLATLGVVLPGQLRRPLLWIVLAVLTMLRVILNWPMADNHAYLLSYWCLAVAVALVSHDPRSCLALNARLLVGLAFACATLWKVVLSPDYLDGRFFRVLLLTDRFCHAARRWPALRSTGCAAGTNPFSLVNVRYDLVDYLVGKRDLRYVPLASGAWDGPVAQCGAVAILRNDLRSGASRRVRMVAHRYGSRSVRPRAA